MNAPNTSTTHARAAAPGAARWRAVILAVIASWIPTGAWAQGAPQTSPQTPQTVAITHATVWSSDDAPVEDATVVIRGDRIISVTVGGPAPSGARTIDAEGGVLTPGFVAVQSALGLVEIGLEGSTRDFAPESGDGEDDPVRASFEAADGFNPTSTLIPVARTGGVTSAVSTPVGGLVSGIGAFLDLAGTTPDDMLVERRAALHVDLGDGGIESAGGAMPVAISRLREVLEDARLYGRQRAAFDRRALREMRLSRQDLENLQIALRGEVPVVVHVSRAADILRVLALREEYGLRIVLAGAEEGWRVADRIAAARVPVIVQPLTNLPAGFRQIGARADNPALLARAGVTILFSTGSAEEPHGLPVLRQEAGNAIAEGLDRGTALQAITSHPVEVFGGGDRGTIAAGQLANVVLWNGDPFEVTTWATRLFIRGEELPVRSRQTALFERYRTLDRVRQGHPGVVLPDAAVPSDAAVPPDAEVAPEGENEED